MIRVSSGAVSRHAWYDVRDGVIVGGRARRLERGMPDGVLHSALDPEEAARKVAAQEAERALLAKKAADEVLAQQQGNGTARR